MDEKKLDKFLAELKRRLQNQPAFHGDFTGSVTVPVFHGGLSGAIRIELLDPQPRNGG